MPRGAPRRLISRMPHAEVSRFRVRYAETDQMGVVYHANYLVWCEVGRTDYIRRFGLSYADMERQGLRLAVSDATLRFLGSARYDDEVTVTTTLAAVKSRALVFRYVIANAVTGARLVEAETQLVCLGPEGRPTPIWPDLRARLASAVVA